MAFDIITFGSAAKDIMVKPKNLTLLKYEKGATAKEVCFPFGSKVDVEEIQFNSGGGATNTAATFANQGLKTAFCGGVGNDAAGLEILKELKALRVDTRFAVITDKKPTNHSIVIMGGVQDRTILVYRGAAEFLGKNSIPFNKLKAKWLYLAPLSGLLCDAFEDLVNFAKERNMKVAVNPGMAQLALPHFTQILQRVDMLFLNTEEASFLTKIPFEQEYEVFAKMDELCPGVLVMTKGADGVSVSDGNVLYSAVPPATRSIVDTTGAGDAFASGFLTDYIRENGDIEKAIQLGMANSVGCLSQIGAKNGLLKKGDAFDGVEVKKEHIVSR